MDNTHNEEKVRSNKEIMDSFVAKAVEVDNNLTHNTHSHCHECGAEAHGWCEEKRKWSCGRCSAAEDHARLAKWFLENCDDEIKEGGLSDNVIRLLAELKVSPSLLKKRDGLDQKIRDKALRVLHDQDPDVCVCPLCSKLLVQLRPEYDYIYKTTCEKGCPNYGWAGGIRGAPGWLERVERMSKQTHSDLDGNNAGR